MKKVLGFLAFLFVFCVSDMSAQYKSKKDLSKDLNNSNGITMNAKQKKEFDDSNNRMIAELEKNDKTNKNKNDRDKEIDRIFDKNEKENDRIFANDENYKKNNKSFKQHRRSVKMKMKLAKLIL
jgi:hypothetical protein